LRKWRGRRVGGHGGERKQAAAEEAAAAAAIYLVALVREGSGSEQHSRGLQRGFGWTNR
jgi:hypothetical protein